MEEKIKGLKKLSAMFKFFLFVGPVVLLLAGYFGFAGEFKSVLSGRFYNGQRFLFMPWVLAGLAFFEILFSAFFLSAYKKNIKNLEWLRTNGQRIEASVTNVELIPSERSSYYILESEWQKPENGQNYKFFEQVVGQPPGAVPGKSTVGVLINYENPKMYFVDLTSIKS